VRDLLGDDSAPAGGFVADEITLGFDNQAASSAVSELHAEQLMLAAEAVAASVVGTFPVCDAADASCTRGILVDLATRAYRRPPNDDEIARLAAVHDWGAADGDLARGLRLVVTTVLQQPQFLYRIELGQGGAIGGDVVQLGPYEMASRLSYLLWRTMPDDTLFDAAAADQLQSREQLEAQARRMLADDRAKGTIADFHAQWLGANGIDNLSKDVATFPEWDESQKVVWRDEIDGFVGGIVFEGEGDLASLLQQGMLTLPGIMAVHAEPSRTSPVKRGVWIRERVLCHELPSAPDDVDLMFPEIDESATLRDRFSQHTSDPACAGCHELIDPIGFGFEHYDALGRFRTHDGEHPVDASGSITATEDADGSFDGAEAMAALLADSQQVHACYTRQWFRYGMGRDADAADACTVEVLEGAFAEGAGDVIELLVALTQTDAFRHRHAVVAEDSP
jgi:Protein of unknown function (DUF1592)/Protein of unknown function (DUF1588)/Protein of unknown function (DUF1595)/Protein of unknown function (DUF1585)/Protein of unknown function (DUF1587)